MTIKIALIYPSCALVSSGLPVLWESLNAPSGVRCHYAHPVEEHTESALPTCAPRQPRVPWSVAGHFLLPPETPGPLAYLCEPCPVCLHLPALTITTRVGSTDLQACLPVLGMGPQPHLFHRGHCVCRCLGNTTFLPNPLVSVYSGHGKHFTDIQLEKKTKPGV